MNKLLIGAGLLIAAGTAAQAQNQDPVAVAQRIDACEGRDIVDAEWLEGRRLQVTCDRDDLKLPIAAAGSNAGNAAAAGAGVTGAAPLLGGLGPALAGTALAAGVVAAASGDGDSTPDTQ
ncbi:hypothetical protein [Tranquillimonas rosea]|uniref:hypothetical protein n=1 Tax=Tranquillimonas rosea TaxID=641238 RepID=UPI003BA8C739